MTARPCGRLIAVVGPSGAGKDTLLAGALAVRPEWVLVRRVITRPADAGGEDHDPSTPDDFAARVAAGDFAVHWTAHGLSYGIPAAALAQAQAGATVLFNGSRAALPAACAAFPTLHVVWITAPTDVLAARIAARGRESQADAAARLARTLDPPPPGARVVMNDGPVDRGVARLIAAVEGTAAHV
jgi:ribose 1,5-bisphosphokinase